MTAYFDSYCGLVCKDCKKKDSCGGCFSGCREPSRRCNNCIVVVILIYSPTLLVCAAAAESAVEGYHGQIYDPLNQATHATNLRNYIGCHVGRL